MPTQTCPHPLQHQKQNWLTSMPDITNARIKVSEESNPSSLSHLQAVMILGFNGCFQMN